MIHGLWKTVENFCALLPQPAGDTPSVDAAIAAGKNWKPARVRACSGCAGDYEDPDRTAWPEEGAEEEDDAGQPVAPESECPMQCG